MMSPLFRASFTRLNRLKPVALTLLVLAIAHGQTYTTWNDYAGSANSMQYSALKQITKSDRVTGEPLWPIEERPVPKSDVPGEQSWPTQPFPSKPPPYARHKFTVEDVNPYIEDAEKTRIRGILQNARNEGLFTPQSLRETIETPGQPGGTNWGGTAADPQTGMRYVRTIDGPSSDEGDFSLAEVFGVRSLGQSDAARAYLRVRQDIEVSGVPRMDIQVRGRRQRIETTPARPLLEAVPAIASKQAPAQLSDSPGVTINPFGQGKAIYCALPLFAAYHQEGTAVFRRLAAWMLQLVHPATARTLMLENAPVNIELFSNARGPHRFVHLLNDSGDKRLSGAARLQDFSTVAGIGIRLRWDGNPRRVLEAPGNRVVPCEWRDGWARFQAAPLTVHSEYRIATERGGME